MIGIKKQPAPTSVLPFWGVGHVFIGAFSKVINVVSRPVGVACKYLDQLIINKIIYVDQCFSMIVITGHRHVTVLDKITCADEMTVCTRFYRCISGEILQILFFDAVNPV